MKIKDIPEEERPREKLLRKGGSALSNEELLAIFLRTGIKDKSAIEIARELLLKFQGLRGLYSTNIEVLTAIKGLGRIKVAQLLAVTELNKRYLQENIINRDFIEDSKMVYDYLFLTMRDLDYEVFKAIYLNGQNQILNIEEIFRGTILQSHVYPREIVKAALRNGATAIICVHNHPSGNPKPSNSDITISKELIKACDAVGISFHDHIIIGDNKYFSFKDEDLI